MSVWVRYNEFGGIIEVIPETTMRELLAVAKAMSLRFEQVERDLVVSRGPLSGREVGYYRRREGEP